MSVLPPPRGLRCVIPSSQTDWIVFAVASALTVLGPYMVYVTNSRKLNLSDPVAIKKKQ